MFSFQALSDEEINAVQNEGLLNDGNYPFIVQNIEQTVSSAGNPMLKVLLRINSDNGDRVISDYLLTTTKMIFKLKHFCDSIGFDNEYKEGKIETSHLIGKVGLCKIGIEKGKPKPDMTGFFRDKNKVVDYMPRLSNPNDVAFNDDIKF